MLKVADPHRGASEVINEKKNKQDEKKKDVWLT